MNGAGLSKDDVSRGRNWSKSSQAERWAKEHLSFEQQHSGGERI